jgi:hypothetical protein
MKVEIGPYLDWWGPYQFADLLQKVGVSEDTCYKIGEWLSNTFVNNLCEWIHSKRKRKKSIQIDKWDTWSMDHTLAMIILPMLKQLKATQHGIPGNLVKYDSNSVQSSFEFYKEGDDAAFNSAVEEWDKIMDKMIWSFEKIVKDDDKFINDAKIQEGLDLFGKYYRALWD